MLLKNQDGRRARQIFKRRFCPLGPYAVRVESVGMRSGLAFPHGCDALFSARRCLVSLKVNLFRAPKSTLSCEEARLKVCQLDRANDNRPRLGQMHPPASPRNTQGLK